MIDLHCHTTASDGTLSPKALVEHAAKLGLTHLAITDHDSTQGVLDAEGFCREMGIHLIPAIELSAAIDGQPVDLLGYGIDPRHPPLLAALDDMVGRRRRRISEMIVRLRAEGVELGEEEVHAQAAGGVVGRPHVARALVQRGIVQSVSDAFERYLKRGRAGYVPKENFSPEEAIALIVNAGGLPVLAHPRYLKLDEEACDRLLDRLIAAGLGGIEVYYSQHTPQDVARFESAARERKLVATGGSDFHGANKPHILLGRGPQGEPLPAVLAERLLAAIDERARPRV